MLKNYLKKTIALGFVFCTSVLLAQNEFYINGDNDAATTEVYVSGKDGTNPTLYVQGEIVNNTGIFENVNGEIELTGDFTNTADGTNAYYNSTGIERFSNTNAVSISGNFTINGTPGTSSNSGRNQLYDVQLNGSNTITLANNVTVSKDGSVTFTGSSTNVVVTSTTNALYIQNTDPAKFSGYSASGDLNKFIEGNLMLDVVANNTYTMPVGDTRADAAQGDGNQIAQLKVNAIGSTGRISAKFTERTTSTTSVPLAICGGTAQAHRRVDAILNNGYWTIINPIGGISNYDITLDPADFNNQGSADDYTIVKDGAATGADPCDFVATALPITHEGLTSFSDFEVGVAKSGSALPIELLSIKAYGVENEYINVDWATATEINNEKFEVQRSIDGKNFSPIGVVAGAGNSQTEQNYTFADHKVAKNVNYYYRLKQIDYDGSYEYTDIVSAKIEGIEEMGGFALHPNPAKENQAINLTIISNIRTNAQVEIFSLIGKHLYSEQMALNEGTNHYQLQTQLPQGQYIAVVKTTQKEFKQKIIITK